MGLKIGATTFLVGILLALLVGLNDHFNLIELTGNAPMIIAWVLLGAGLLVGILNITNAESLPFVVGVVGFTILIALVAIPSPGEMIGELLDKLTVPLLQFLVPSAIIVAGTLIVDKAKN